MLSFLAPLFFVGLAAVAVPLVVHLVNRERKQVTAFPSLMFLERVPYKSVRRRRIRHWALLALRCLVLAALAVAFARPFATRADAAAIGGSGAREVVVLLDRSYSMSREGQWRRAQAEARRVIDGLRPGDRASVVLFDETAEAATTPTGDLSRLRAAIDGAQPGWGRTRFAPPLRLAQKLLAESDRPRREVVLVSDFPRRAWDGREDVRLPEGATLAWRDVGGDTRPDVAVAQVTMRRDRAAGRDQLVVQARLTATSACAGTTCGAPRPVPVTLALAGRDVETRTASLPPNGSTTVDFAAVAVPAGRTRGTVQVAADALTRDDTWHFVVSPTQELSVLLVEPASPRANQSLYLRRALELAAQPPTRVDVRAAERVSAADLEGRALVVLNDAVVADGAFARRLAEHVRAGGGLLTVLGPRAADAAAPLRAILPATPGDVVDRGVEGGRLANLDLSHPALEPFAQPRGGDFASARVLRYRAARLADSAVAIARWDDGGIALAERRVGAGISLVWTSTFDTYWNDLALQPVFLPLVHRLSRHAARLAEARASRAVGELLEAPRGAAGATVVAEAPSGLRIPVRDSVGTARGAVPLREAGFYTLRAAG
ncbi:MAG TPA: BatA domain-containing protein, partial [Gemmatimonadaceae bacterium]|nr:BatA domain-containing protein [Gemmatimonadaceae bacterium]